MSMPRRIQLSRAKGWRMPAGALKVDRSTRWAKLALHRRGARRLRLELRRVDRGITEVEIGLARPMRDPARIAALFARGVAEIDSGFGIDALRLSAPLTEALAPEQLGGEVALRQEDALADLLSSLGNRIGFERVLRLLPAQSLIPERSFLMSPAAYSVAEPMPASPSSRPLASESNVRR